MSFKSLLHGLLAIPMLFCHITRCVLAAVKAFCLSKLRKPPDKATDSSQCSESGYIACSSTINEISHVTAFILSLVTSAMNLESSFSSAGSF